MISGIIAVNYHSAWFRGREIVSNVILITSINLMGHVLIRISSVGSMMMVGIVYSVLLNTF